MLKHVLEVIVVARDDGHVELQRIEAIRLFQHNLFAVIHLDLVGLEDRVAVLHIDREGVAGRHRLKQEVPIPVGI